MDEIAALVAKKTGLSQDKAKVVVEIVIDIIKKKLPAPVAAEVDAVLSGKGPNLGDAAGLVEGLFGKK